VIAEACAAADVPPVLPDAPAGVEAVRRGRALFLLNHGRDTVAIELPGPYRSLLNGAPYERALRLAARDADVLVEAA
jgi:beta-galactosidase